MGLPGDEQPAGARQDGSAWFRLLEIGGKELQSLLSRARERRYYEVPWPVTAYDRLVQSNSQDLWIGVSRDLLIAI